MHSAEAAAKARSEPKRFLVEAYERHPQLLRHSLLLPSAANTYDVCQSLLGQNAPGCQVLTNVVLYLDEQEHNKKKRSRSSEVVEEIADVDDNAQYDERALCIAYAKCFDAEEKKVLQAVLDPQNSADVFHNIGRADSKKIKVLLNQCKAISRCNKEWAARTK